MSLVSAMVSCEHAKRTAPLRFPSSSLEATSEVSASNGSRVLGRFGWVWRCDGTRGGSDSALICSLISLTRFQRRPPCLGARRQRVAKRRRRFQEDWSFLATAASTTKANFLAATSREPRGILFRIFTAYLFGRRCRSSSFPWTGEAGPCCTLSNGGDAVLLMSGGVQEPEQRLSTGPWVRTKPIFVRVKTLRYTEHAALVRLAPSVRASWASRVSSMLSCSLLDDSHTYSSTSTPSDDDGCSSATAIVNNYTSLDCT